MVSGHLWSAEPVSNRLTGMAIVSQPRAVVTGGAGGLGRAFCLALARRGARVLVADRDLAGAEETVRLVDAAGAVGHAVRCDVSDHHEVAALLDQADGKLGGVDLVVNNAGVAVAGPVGQVPLENWDWIVSINLMGVVYGCHYFVPRFLSQRSGLISAPGMAPYNATKAAVVSLSETLAGELLDSGVGVSVLCPTFFRTNIMASSRRSGLDAGMETTVTQRMDASRLQADDVARIALEECDRGRLYIVPMSDGRWGWRMKRLMPERFASIGARMLAKMRERAVVSAPGN